MFGYELAERLQRRVFATGYYVQFNNIYWYHLCIVVCPIGQRAAGTDVTPVREFAIFNEANAFVRRFGQSGVWQ